MLGLEKYKKSMVIINTIISVIILIILIMFCIYAAIHGESMNIA